MTERPQLRSWLTSCAVALAQRLCYRSAGTVEFLLDDSTGDFFFLEMNTRLQVEHGITELCHDVDLVILMLRQADFQLAGQGGIPSNELLEMQKDSPNGAAIEIRVCCENPGASFFPSSGYIQELAWPGKETARVDTWIRTGTVVTPYFGEETSSHAKLRSISQHMCRYMLTWYRLVASKTHSPLSN